MGVPVSARAIVTLRVTGNSLALTLPRGILEVVDWRAGDEVLVSATPGTPRNGPKGKAPVAVITVTRERGKERRGERGRV